MSHGRLGMASSVSVRCDAVRQAGCGKACFGEARHGMAGMVRLGRAGLGTVGPVMAGYKKEVKYGL